MNPVQALLVDDNPLARAIAKGLVEEGYEVVRLEDVLRGASAADRAHNPALVRFDSALRNCDPVAKRDAGSMGALGAPSVARGPGGEGTRERCAGDPRVPATAEAPFRPASTAGGVTISRRLS